MSRSDPIRSNYFDAVEAADKASDRLFYLGALLSFGALLVDSGTAPILHGVVNIAFTLVVIGLFIAGLASRVYLAPRAEDKRRQDFFSSAYSVDLLHQKSEGYYNNTLTEPLRRLGAQVLENSLFSKTIALRMVRVERAKVCAYLALWLICLLNRRSDLGWIVAASQAVFSEQVFSKYVRLEWLRMRFEKTFDDVYRLFQTKPAASKFNAMALEAFSAYEASKSSAGITLSSKVFELVNPSLSLEWEGIKKTLAI
jgi:hypothetical protein